MADNVWRLRARGDADLEEAMLRNDIVAVGGAEMGDLSDRPSLDELREELRRRFPERPERGITTFVGYWRQFLYEMQPGDAIALSLSGKRVAIGLVTGGYSFRPSADEHTRHRRPVEWLARDLPRDRFDPDIKATLDSRGTICRIKAADARRRLLIAAETGMDPGAAADP